MVPATFQVPAAAILVAGGLVACFAGYRMFRLVLGIYGFILGALFASGAMGTEHTIWMIGAALAGGLAGALILIAAYFVGVALLGAGIGALAAGVLWAWFGSEPGAPAVILFSIAGALAALALQRYVIVGATAFGGAWTIIVGALALAGGQAAEAARSNIWLPYPMSPAPGQYWVLLIWLTLGVTGVFVQLRVTGRNRT